MRRLVIIAEVPGPGVTSRLMEGRQLSRLTVLMGLTHVSEVHRRYDALNLIPAPDPGCVKKGRRSLRQAATEMLPSLVGAPVLLLGARVSLAFGVLPRPYFEWREVRLDDGSGRAMTLLHASMQNPSTVNRTMNDRLVLGQTVEFLRRVRDEEADGTLGARATANAEAYARSLSRGEREAMLSLPEAATYLGLAEHTVITLAKARRVGCYRGGPWVRTRFRAADLDAYRATQYQPMAAIRVERAQLVTGIVRSVEQDVGEPRGKLPRRRTG